MFVWEMRVILYPNGSVVNNSLDVDLIPGTTVQSEVTIPGYVAGSMSVVTDLQYDYAVVGDIITISIYVPPTYGASGTTSLVLSYATISIYGKLAYIHDVTTGETARSVDITNDSGSSFYAEVGVAEGDDIYTATEVDYAIVGSLEIEQGSARYPLDSDVYGEVIYNLFPDTMSVNLIAKISVSGQDPLPGTLTIVSEESTIDVPIISGTTLLGVPEDVVDIQEIQNTNQYIITTRETVPLRVVMNAISVTNTITGEDIPFVQDEAAILFLARPGSYLLK